MALTITDTCTLCDACRPVCPNEAISAGDTIYTIRTNVAKGPKYEDRGLTRAKYEVFKEQGELVLVCEHIQTVLYRDPKTARQGR
jgi:ferredoxin